MTKKVYVVKDSYTGAVLDFGTGEFNGKLKHNEIALNMTAEVTISGNFVLLTKVAKRPRPKKYDARLRAFI